MGKNELNYGNDDDDDNDDNNELNCCKFSICLLHL